LTPRKARLIAAAIGRSSSTTNTRMLGKLCSSR